MFCKATTTTLTTNWPEKMAAAATAPVAIGTRGTVGSLVRKEIEYFNKIDIVKCRSSKKPQGPSFWSLKISWKLRKKRRGSSNGFIPGICSAVEVVDTNRFTGNIPGFSYRILKDDDIPI